MTTPEAPVCYRHPHEHTWMRCTRCDRPICTDCMISASVGFQCPECVYEGAKSVRQPVTIAGGTLIQKPLVTYVLIGLNVAAFLWALTAGINAAANQWGMWPYGIAVNDQWWRLMTGAFMHGGFLHIAFNMYILFTLGPMLERVLGHGRFVVVYLVSALGGAVVSYLFSPINLTSVGASGAIFGLMGALVVAGKKLNFNYSQVLMLIGLNLVIGFFATGVDWRAHLGGLAVGIIMSAIMLYAPANRRLLVQVAGTLVVLGILAAACVWRTGEIIAAVSGGNPLI